MNFPTFQQVFKFLEEIDFKIIIKNSCTSYFNKNNSSIDYSPFRINLNLDYNNNNKEFLQLLIEEPKEFKFLCEDYIFIIAKNFIGNSTTTAVLKREQISCSIKLSNLPMLDQYKLKLHCTHLNLGLTFIRCIILEVYPHQTYM
jgi:DNA replicative helicase MCM subunit Mcm2 (Cdc46/Mcm family)